MALSQTVLQLAVSLLTFCLVWSIDPLHQYKDDILAKIKHIPQEFSTEFSNYNQRQRRDTKPTGSVQNDHSYYKTLFLPNGNTDSWFKPSDESFKKDVYLSNGALKSKNFKLKFTFPYYGHPVTNVSITTGGFLYVGYVETRLKMKVMYVAPLMAYFNTSINETSAIFYFSNATQFTTQWSNVFLQNDPKAGPFSFQCTLFKNGKIVFAYKSLPIRASKIPESPEHHVKIGISDSFIGYKWWYIRNQWYKVRIFYIYHSVKYPLENVTSNASLIITPLPNCVIAKNCTHCINLAGLTDFSCAWCSALKRCSDGLDRHRVEWFAKSCHKKSVVKYEKCLTSNGNVYSKSSSRSSSSGVNIGVIIAILIVLIIIIAVGAWCFYAYTHPVSRSGLFLIELRHKPAQLFRRANEATSTNTGAATGTSTA